MEKKEVNVEKGKKKEGKEGRETGREGGRWEERKQVSKQKVVLSFPVAIPFPGKIDSCVGVSLWPKYPQYACPKQRQSILEPFCEWNTRNRQAVV